MKNVLSNAERERIAKSFMHMDGEGGVHGHYLVRNELRTIADGAHQHMFTVQALGNKIVVLRTEYDGSHQHELASSDAMDTGSMDSPHQHVVRIYEDFIAESGEKYEAGMIFIANRDGAHAHGAEMLTRTNFDAGHEHELVLKDVDGKELTIRSLNVAQFIADFGPFDFDLGMDPGMVRMESPEVVVKALDQKGEAPVSKDQRLMMAAFGYEIEKSEAPETHDVINAAGLEIISKEEERQEATGIVLEPEKVDAQDDVISAEEIEKAQRSHMKNGGTIKFRHKGKLRSVKVLESYIAPANFSVDGTNGKQKVRKGSWILTIYVPDKDLWAVVKKKGLNAFSVGGMAVRQPETA